MKEEIINKLDQINWDFSMRVVVDDGEIYPFNNRKYHSYPATFVPEIPFTLIEVLTAEGALVMDPFGGVGTTFVQALIQKRVPVSIDNNSIAAQITKDFYTLFNPKIDITELQSRAIQIVETYDEKVDYFSTVSGMKRNLEDWYEKKTLNQVAFLLDEYKKVQNDSNKEGLLELFHLCLSNLLTTVCSQNGGWAYIADNVKPKADKLKDKGALERFKANIALCTKNIQSYKVKLNEDTSFIYSNKEFDNVICGDFSTLDVSNFRDKVDLVVTSPPYPRMIDYVKSQRLSFYMEERDFNEELATEIGARARRTQVDTIKTYVESMKKCNNQIIASLKKGGYLCYVLPDFSMEEKQDRKEAIDAVIDDCTEKGMRMAYRTVRCIPGTKRSNNIKWASLKQEQIIVLEKV